jgi:2OG-Fe(II) oxygenase superfamily
LLSQPKHHLHPFPFFSADYAFSDDQCATLEQFFSNELDWQHQDGLFYQCSIRDVTEVVPAHFQNQVLARMRTITGLPLINRIQVTAQRMLPGQVIGVHSDRPLLGYEIARLIVQLNHDWRAEHGGVLELFLALKGQAVLSMNPEHNTAIGFLLHPDSFHAVTEVTQARQTVVFNFWHPANTPELAVHIQGLFANLQFSEFPEALNPIANAAEASLPEELSFRAGTAALALQRWGYEPALVVTGYLHSAGLSLVQASDQETYAAVLLADWVATLYRDSFDLARWTNLQETLESSQQFPRLMPTWQLCLPRLSTEFDPA